VRRRQKHQAQKIKAGFNEKVVKQFCIHDGQIISYMIPDRIINVRCIFVLIAF
jgi:hypothetical protein